MNQGKIVVMDKQAATPPKHGGGLPGFDATPLQVGMGATMIIGGDRYPYTVIAVSKSQKKITVQGDCAMFNRDLGDYEYFRNEDATIYEVSLRKNGHWIHVGGSSKGSRRFIVGRREKYTDPNI